MRLSLALVAAGCAGGSPAAPDAPPAAPPGSGAAWSPALAVEVPSQAGVEPCPDADGDGFPSAVACPGTPAARADCDDQDPAVTPATERWVRPGPFLMGSASPEAGRDERPVHVVQLAGFCLDRTEADAGGGDRRPLEGVTWAQAREHCAGLGKALPTEAQWEKAARGGCEFGQDPSRCDPGDQRTHPWGDDPPTCARANHQAGGAAPHPCHGASLPVGSLPDGAGPYGHLDLSGNVWEYVADAYHPAVYGAGGPREDPGGPAGGSVHVLRGGGWNTFSTNMRAANRFQDLVAGSATGVRCARPTAPPRADAVPSLDLVRIEGRVERRDAGPLSGRALYVAAFDEQDLDPSGMPLLGRSPLAELRLDPHGGPDEAFLLPVPRGARVRLTAALDAGEPAQGAPPSGSGGAGSLREVVVADGDRAGLLIVLDPLPGPPP